MTASTEEKTTAATEGEIVDETAAQGQEGAEQAEAPTLESVTAELEAVRRALKKANGDAERHRRKAQEVRPADEVATEAETAAAAKYKPLVVRTAARAAFAEAGLQATAEALPRVLRMLDIDALDLDDDGDVIGLAEQVEEIKETLPALFAVPAKAKPPRVDAAAKAKPDVRPKGDAARLFAALDGAA